VPRIPRGIVGGIGSPSPAPGRTPDGRSDRRWAVLAESGEWVTITRARDPSEEDIRRAEDNLRRLGAAGWPW
jgi:hypothetical protein